MHILNSERRWKKKHINKKHLRRRRRFPRRVAALSDDTWVCPESVMSALQDVTGPWTMWTPQKSSPDGYSQWNSHLMAIEIVDFPIKNGDLYGFVWTCWVNIPNEIAI